MPDTEQLRVAEGHGMIVGALAAGGDARAAAELAALTAGEATAGKGLSFAVESLDGLRAGRFGLPAILLDETLALAARVEMLCVFARGFLSGLGQAGERLAALDAAGSEMLKNVETLSRGADLEGEDEAQAEERAYRELLEYLRFAAAYFYRSLA